MTGEELRAIREELGMTQSGFGGRVGYSSKSIANFESGRTLIPTSLEKHALDVLALARIRKIMKDVVPLDISPLQEYLSRAMLKPDTRNDHDAPT